MVQRRAGVQAHDRRRPRHGRARVHACEVGPRRAADDHAGPDLCERVGGLHHFRRGAQRSDVPRRSDCARSGSPRPGPDTGQLSALLLDAGRNTTENLLDAKKGYVASVHLETAGQWLGGDFDYREVSAEGRYYQSLGSAGGGRRARPCRLDRLVRLRKTSSCRSSSATSWAARRTSAAGAATRCRR